MTKESRWRKILWLEHMLWLLGVWTLVGVAVTGIAIGSGLINPILRHVLINRLENLTGSRVEIRTVSVGWFSLNATVNGLTIHGKEPTGIEPLCTVEQAKIGLRIDSFWGRRVSLNDLVLIQPRVHLLVQKDGRSNLPTFKQSASTQPLQETLLNLHVRHLEIRDGWFLYNNLKSLVALEGGDLRLNITHSSDLQHPLYLGMLDWNSIELARRRDVPVPANLSAKFSLSREGFTVEQAVVDAGRSHVDLHAEAKNLESPDWTYRYRAWLDLLDIREAFRTPEVPLGRVDIRGDGTLKAGQIRGTGSFAGDNIALGFLDFHAANLSSRSSYVLEPDGVVLPDFAAYALGGSVKGRVTMKFDGLKFRAETKIQGVRLGAVAPAINHEGFPIDSLHWDAVISGDTVETWHDNFREFDISARMHWEEPDEPLPGHIPVNSDAVLRYRYGPDTLDLNQFDFETPDSRGSFTGVLHPKQTSLDAHLDIGSLAAWDDFIHAIAGDKPGTPDAKILIDGALIWNGRITGPSDGPTFSGHFQGEHARYDNFALDSISGDLTYSPTQLVITRGQARQGAMQAGIEGSLQLSDWEFRPENRWESELNLEKVPLASLEQLAGWKYPVEGLLTGQFHGRGTRADPVLTGLVDLADANAYTVPFNRLRGQLTVLPDEVRLSNAELRFFAPGTEGSRGAGIVTGSVAYHYADESLTTDLVGASLPLANFRGIKASGLPVDGQISFRLKSSGPLQAPLADGSFRVVDFNYGSELIGSFEGDLHSDGKVAQLKLGSAMSEGAISGGITLGLADPLPLDGKVSVRNLNLDPYLLSSLHLGKFSGHGVADGEITVQGALRNPETLTIDGNFSRVALNYGGVQLENQGPIHLTSTRDSLKILSMSMKGTDTNAQMTGSIQFTGRRSVALEMNGSVDLRLLSGLVPDVNVAGHANINASFGGTLDRPRIVGRVNVSNASVRSADFPTGLSNVKGDLVFDANRLFFDNVTGEAGGGLITLAGSANYSEKPLRYDVIARTDRIRIRYPEGMSWQMGGSLRLAGTLDGGLLSGKVVVQRVNLNEGIEAVGTLTSSSSSSSTSSSFLRNLQLDVEGSSTPDARLEWPGAHLEAESNLRVRGTAEHPILLGHIHVLSGDLYFRDNHYKVSRGDLNFANPFRLDPVINFEATTTIQQYEITLNFTGQASKLSLSYRSDPPLPGNDIITLLALGQTSSESTIRAGATGQAGAAGNSGATALLSEAISSQLGGRVERLFGITRFRVDPGLAGVGTTTSGSGQNVAARVTVEQQVTRDLAVTYVSNVSSTQEQVIQIEYNLNRNISVVALRDQNGTFGVDIKIKKRFP
jgi:translocation and assembly module TamB